MLKLTMKFLIHDFSYYFEQYGITKRQLKNSYEKNQSVGDYAWSILQKILYEIVAAYQKRDIRLEDFYAKNSDTYKQMAYVLKLEKKDSRKIQTLQFKNEVKNMELAYPGLIGVKILSYGCCAGCHPYNNQILTVEEALILAKTTETRCNPRFEKYSRCTFIPEIKDEENNPVKIAF